MNTNTIKILFFGSTSDSLIVLEQLFNLQPTHSTSSVQATYPTSPGLRGASNFQLAAVITQPPRPTGRKQVITPTPTEVWAKEHQITVLSFPNVKENPYLYEDEGAVINSLETFKANILISASYGQKIPTKTIHDAKYGGLNVHPSLLPRWRGPDPIPWAILSGDHQTGVTVITISDQMDEGKIIAQKKIPLTDNEEREPLRKKLFEIGAEILVETLPKFIDGTIKGEPQDSTKVTSARRLTRDDGFISWDTIQNAMIIPETAVKIVRSLRAFEPWPGVWTKISEKRLKVLKAHLSPAHLLVIDLIQWEGKNPIIPPKDLQQLS